mgnify:CR=1 FL=1
MTVFIWVILSTLGCASRARLRIPWDEALRLPAGVEHEEVFPCDDDYGTFPTETWAEVMAKECCACLGSALLGAMAARAGSYCTSVTPATRHQSPPDFIGDSEILQAHSYRKSYLKFDLSETFTERSIKQSYLLLYKESGGTPEISWTSCDDWDEQSDKAGFARKYTMSYPPKVLLMKEKVSPERKMQQISHSNPANPWDIFDVTEIISQGQSDDKLVSFVIESSTGDPVAFFSKENPDPLFRPRLVMCYGSQASQKPSTQPVRHKIVLRDGDVIIGRIIDRDESTITIETDHGVLKVERRDVEKILKIVRKRRRDAQE